VHCPKAAFHSWFRILYILTSRPPSGNSEINVRPQNSPFQPIPKQGKRLAAGQHLIQRKLQTSRNRQRPFPSGYERGRTCTGEFWNRSSRVYIPQYWFEPMKVVPCDLNKQTLLKCFGLTPLNIQISSNPIRLREFKNEEKYFPDCTVDASF